MKYTKAMIEAIELEVEDVVLTSGSSSSETCSAEVVPCPNDNTDDCANELL